MRKVLIGMVVFNASIAFAMAADQVGADRVINDYPAGSVSQEQGLKHWQKFYEVASHPRCTNCHAGPDNIPMWSGPSYGRTRPHGMNIEAGQSRIGAETVVCSACHTVLKNPNPAANAIPHSPPKVAAVWKLAPVSTAWFGKSSEFICNQVKDPQRNGKRSIRDVAVHLGHDKVLRWAWSPGGNRQPPPSSLVFVRAGRAVTVFVRSRGDGREEATETSRAQPDTARKRHWPGNSITRRPNEYR